MPHYGIGLNMKIMFSQNKEELHIGRYFRGVTGNLLDLGAYDGVKFSNSLKLLLNGWTGTLIEASPTVYAELQKNMQTYLGERVVLGNFAIGTYDGVMKFYNNNDAVATGVDADMEKWSEYTEFETIEVPVRTYKTVFEGQKFDFISIDIEGMDYDVLTQIDLDEVGCRCVCIEYNSDMVLYRKFREYFLKFGMRLLHKNAENVIYVK